MLAANDDLVGYLAVRNSVVELQLVRFVRHRSHEATQFCVTCLRLLSIHAVLALHSSAASY